MHTYNVLQAEWQQRDNFTAVQSRSFYYQRERYALVYFLLQLTAFLKSVTYFIFLTVSVTLQPHQM